ncbi:N-formylglutamate amidohydrolase [Qipengyuania proteolytica]|uniref:N-formylglutamate amidohydrolase n=1 Tax=Qipengyuania proteolytica TaxID=2867239 RepID=UPI001FFDCAEA|nr:N-formylglutamate amidohydrolase [Qipengyuania proteolytica]
MPILIAIPHGGTAYPDAIIDALRDPAQVRLRLEDRHVGEVGKLAARRSQVSCLLAHAPRAMIDLNRSTDDIDWGMVTGSRPRATRNSLVNRRSRNGLGLIPRRVSGMGEIWRNPIAREEIDRRIAAIYTPYHLALGRELERLRDAYGAALLLDLHSMPPLRSSSPDQLPAEFVVGDRFGAACDAGLADLAMRYLAGHARRVAHNRPYSGGHMLDRYGQPMRGIHAIQVEICRSLYLDARLDQTSARLPAIARLVAGLVEALGNEVLQLGPSSRLSQAAE